MLKTLIITLDKFASPSRQGEDVFELYYCKEHSPHGNAFSMTKEEFSQLSNCIIDYFKGEPNGSKNSQGPALHQK